jgi:hypothetical protein
VANKRKPGRTARSNSANAALRHELERVRVEQRTELKAIVDSFGLGDEFVSPQTMEEAVRGLGLLATALDRYDHRFAAAAIARYLLGECASLEESFRLRVRNKRGRKLSEHSKELVRATQRLRAEGLSWITIEARLETDASTLRRLSRDHAATVHNEDVVRNVIAKLKG